MQLNYIHGLRGVAMLFIVFGHAIYFQFDWSGNLSTKYFLQDLLSGGTILFVFVAGFLFEYLSPRYQYSKYMKTKFKNVVFPYLLVSIPALLDIFVLGDPARNFPHLEGSNVGAQLLWYYAVGGAHVNYSLWFIPMIILFFVLSPLFVVLARRPVMYWPCLLLFILPILIHRDTVPLVSPVRAFFYFLPVYILGMMMSFHRDQLEAVCHKYFYGFLVVFVALVFGQYFWGNCHGNCATPGAFEFPHGYIDWALIQKVVFCFAVIGLFLRYPWMLTRPLSYIADTSFTTFFFHVYFFYAFSLVLRHSDIDGSVLTWFVRGAASLLCCLLVAWLGRKVFGRYSRSVIGS